jgi:S-formylglutathione hydrolase FrmB
VQDEVISPALNGQKKPFLVYLPPSYNTSAGRTKRYPTLYLLHGSPGHDNDWLTGGKADQSANTLIAQGKMSERILILPDGNGRPGETSEWGNSFDRKQNMETYIAVDLVKYVDQKYRTMASPAYRSIGGLSMGGFGAMNIAMHHPDVFGTVITLGGYYRAEGSVWGNNAIYIRDNSPFEMLPVDKQAWKLHMYIGAATKDQPYYGDTLQFVRELDRLHIPYGLDIQDGFHSWKVWQVQMYNAFMWLRQG